MQAAKRVFLTVIGLLIALVSFSGLGQAAGVVDSTFNAQIQTSTYLPKIVYHLVTLSDGKILAAGDFNNYNGTPVGGLIRLNADATLDTTFNNDLIATGSRAYYVNQQSDGKILLQGDFTLTDGTVYTNTIIRLNADGSYDSTFNYPYTGNIYNVRIDAMGRLMIAGFIQVSENGQTVNKYIIRLNDDGSIDATFDASPSSNCLDDFTTQGNKYLYACHDFTAQQARLYRLNEDGTIDNSFNSTLIGNAQVLEMMSQSDGKILILSDHKIFRVSENGGIDPDFQITTSFSPGQPRKILLQSDGRITIAYSINSPFGMRIIRLLPDGTFDPAFMPYNYVNSDIQGHTVLDDGSVLIGDQGINSSSNRFIRLLPSGEVDPEFNPGGTGFQNINPGKIRAIKVLADEKVLIGGDFDKVNNSVRTKIARLNSDSTLDDSFQINTNATGNYFSQISDVYHFDIQSDGKIIVSGNFTYVVSGGQKSNLVRLNPNGSIDPTFNLSIHINDNFPSSNAGRNKPLQTASGKVLVGTSRLNTIDTTSIPLLLNINGSKDNSFNPSVYNTANSLVIFDTALQTDGKILISGRYTAGDINQNVLKGFVARLNADGTVDQSFQPVEIINKQIFAFTVLQNGQMLIISGSNLQSEILRLNSDGTLDNSFNTGVGANGRINAIAVLPDGKILIGGLFSAYGNEPRQNIAMLNPEGILQESLGEINREVLCITVDNQGRILIGGHFTSINDVVQSLGADNSGTQQVTRSYLARLIVSSQSIRNPRFDFDGDGRTDISIFRPTAGEWWILRSSDNSVPAAQFGSATDRIVPADYTGDGRTDIAFFRESTGEWFIIRSEDNSFYAFPFGSPGDKPVPADFDGDGKADPTVFRPSNAVWYTLRSSDSVISFTQFGISEDVPLPSDFDGDGKADFGVFRPTLSEWWIQKSTGGIAAFQFGQIGDKPVPADYTGDGKTDVAFWRPSNGFWYVLRSEDSSFYAFPFGITGDLPVTGDYDGDGRADAAVFRPSNSTWYLQQTTNGFSAVGFGIIGDIPVPSAFLP